MISLFLVCLPPAEFKFLKGRDFALTCVLLHPLCLEQGLAPSGHALMSWNEWMPERHGHGAVRASKESGCAVNLRAAVRSSVSHGGGGTTGPNCPLMSH